MPDSLTSSLSESFDRGVEILSTHLPNIFAAIAIALIGWLVAFLLRSLARFLVIRIQDSLDRIKWLQTRTQQVKAYRTAPSVIASVIFWIVLLFFLVAAVEAIGLPAVSDLLGRVTIYLPRVLAAVIILLAGLFAGDLVRNVVSRALSGTRASLNDFPARAAQILAVVAAGIIAIEQLGFDGTVLVTVLAISFGTALGAVALAFALGSRDFVSNMLAVQQISKSYAVGDTVKIDEVEGRIAEITQTAFIVESEAGRFMVPARQFVKSVSLRRPPGA
jgi:small-conductance mechanosensitive channel